MSPVIRQFCDADFAAIQQLSQNEGWPTPVRRPRETLEAWTSSGIALVAVEHGEVVGFLRALTDGRITTYLAELLVAPAHRGRGIGKALVAYCQAMYPRCRIDVLSTEVADEFYRSQGFREFRGYRKSQLL